MCIGPFLNVANTHVVAELDGRINVRLGLAAAVLHRGKPRHFGRTVQVAFGRGEVHRVVSHLVRRATGITRFR